MIAKESKMKRQWISARVVAAGAHAREVFVWRMAS